MMMHTYLSYNINIIPLDKGVSEEIDITQNAIAGNNFIHQVCKSPKDINQRAVSFFNTFNAV